MTKKLKLFEKRSLEKDVLMQPIALLGNRGAGKTYTMTKIYECAHALGVQCIAIDPTGKFWGLRLAADGKAPGLKDMFIFGGKHGDVPIVREKGALVAKTIVDRNIHAVIDVSQMRKAERRQFLTDFCEELFVLKKALDVPSPTVVFLEEAHALAPQKPQIQEAALLGAVEDIVREGRNCGLGVVVADQRPATVNKNVLALTEALIVLRTTWAADRKVYQDWIVQKGGEKNIDLDAELGSLKKGAGFFYHPIEETFLRVQVAQKWTYDSSATVKIGERRQKIGRLSPVDVDGLRSSMGEVVAELERDDPRALKRQITELQARLKQRAPPAPKATEPKIVKVKVPIETELKRQEKVLTRATSLLNEMIGRHEHKRAQEQRDATAVLSHIAKFTAALDAATSKLSAGKLLEMPKLTVPANAPVQSTRLAAEIDKQIIADVERSRLKFEANRKRDDSAARAGTPNVPMIELKGLGTGERRMLETLAVKHPEPLNKVALGTMSGFPAKGSTFRTYLPRLKRLGLAAEHDGLLALTAAGVAEVGDQITSAPKTSAERIAYWRNQLGSGELRMFDVLVNNGGQPLSKDRLGELSGFEHTGSTFRTYLPKLIRLGIVNKDGPLCVRASPDLFV